MKKVIIIIVAVALMGAIVWTLASNKKEIDSRKEVKTFTQEIAVTVSPVEMIETNGQLQLVGTAEPNRQVKVASESSGKITELKFKLGDYVNKGTVLAKVDDVYKRLDLENAQLTFDNNKEDYERYQNLIKGDAASETQLRDKQLAFENSKIQLENAKKQLDDTQITAPFGGYITSQNTELGAFVNAGTVIAEMVDIAQLKISLAVSESNVYALRTGQEVNVTTSVYPDVSYTGTVSHISPQGDNAHIYPVEIVMANSREHPIKAGTYVNASVNLGKTVPVLMIPRDAIVSSVKEPSVYLVNGEIAQLVKIGMGSNYGSYLEVRSGLKEGDKVVTTGQINLTDNAKVKITNQN
jgi:RND family efflux transporter MFP subunit